MKKIIALTSPVLVLVAVFIAVAALETERVSDWERALSNYLTQSRSSGFVKLRATTPANKPWNFTETMGTPVHGGWPWGIEELPYPPTAVQCVLVERIHRLDANTTTQTQQLIFVARHSDKLWRIGWLVHKGPTAPFSPQTAELLAAIDCELNIRVNND